MMPIEISAADHVNMFVNDLEESVDFYRRLFGTDLKPKAKGMNKGVKWCIIGIPKKFYFCLYQCRTPQVHDPDTLHINHVGFHVPDFDQTVDRIKALGIEIEYRGEPITWKGSQNDRSSRSLYIKDPNGYYIEFSEYFGGRLD